MSEFKLYKSDGALRTENYQQGREIDRLTAEVNRLKAMVGEEIVERPQQRFTAQQGEAFRSGNCTVSIGPSKKTAPGIAAPAAGVPRQIVAATATATPAARQMAAPAGYKMAFVVGTGGQGMPAPNARVAVPLRSVPAAPTVDANDLAGLEREALAARQRATEQNEQAEAEDSTKMRFSMIELR